jgi:hypothetical protein
LGSSIYLSKSKLISGWQCAKRLWLEKNAPESLQYSAGTEAAFAVGHQVGDAAQSLFPEGVLIGHDQDLSQAIGQTQEIMSDSGPVTVFEATFQTNGVLIRADILIRNENDEISLIEVKAATKLKEYYLYDCAIQLWVLEQSGLNVQQLELAHINNRFVYQGDGDYQGLFTYIDVLGQARSLRGEVQQLIEEMRVMLSGGEPDIAMGSQCTTPFECPFHEYCLGPQPEMPVAYALLGQVIAQART